MKTFFTFSLIILTLTSFAQTSYTWDGGGGDNNMSTSGNWGGSTPAGAEYLNFAGSTRLTPTNDLSATNRYQLFFNSGASAFTLGGSTTNTFYDYSSNRPKIENNSSNSQTVNFPVTCGYSGGMEINPVSDDLTLGGAFVNGGYDIRVYGNNNHNLYLTGGASGSGKFTIYQNSNVYIQSACSYSGNTELDGNGDMYITSGGSLGSTDVKISSGSTFNVESSVTVPSLSERGTSNGGTVAISSGQILTINGANKATLYQNSISGAGGLTMAGSGTTSLAVYGTQSFTGAVVVSGGKITTGVALSSTSFTVSGGELEFTAADVVSNSANITLSGSGTVDFQQNETINNLTLNGGTLNIAAGKVLTINGTLRIDASTTINLNSTGSIAYGTGATLEYSTGGSYTSTNSEWPSTDRPDNVTLSDAGTAVSLHAARTIDNTLTLTAGTIALGSNNLTMGTSGAFSGTPSWGSTTANYVIAEGSGKLLHTVTTSATLFPVGTSTAYMPIRLALSSGSSQFEVNLVTPTGLTDATYALDKIWDISGSGTLDIDMQWPDGAEGANFPTTGVTFLKKTGSTWSDLSKSASRSGSDPYTISFSSISCCSQFVPGGSQALPIELISFTGKRLVNDIILNWATASEINNSHFILERSDDNQSFEFIANIHGAGTSFELNEYEFIDQNVASGAMYYRLTQMDFDGTETTFDNIKISDETIFENVVIQPNPVGNSTRITVNIGESTNLEIIIMDMLGKEVIHQVISSPTEHVTAEISTTKLAPGSYVLAVRYGDKVITRKLLK